MAQTTDILFSMQVGGEYEILPTKMCVHNDNAENCGFPDDIPIEEGASVLDAVIEAHMLRMGDAFTPEACHEQLELAGNHWLSKAFGQAASYSAFAINTMYLRDEESKYTRAGYRGLAFNQARIEDGDHVEVFIFCDSAGMDYYTYFIYEDRYTQLMRLGVGEKASLVLEGLMYGYGGPLNEEDREKHHLIQRVDGAQLLLLDIKTGETQPMEGIVSDEDGNVELCFNEPGTYRIISEGGTCRNSNELTHAFLCVHVA